MHNGDIGHRFGVTSFGILQRAPTVCGKEITLAPFTLRHDRPDGNNTNLDASKKRAGIACVFRRSLSRVSVQLAVQTLLIQVDQVHVDREAVAGSGVVDHALTKLLAQGPGKALVHVFHSAMLNILS